MLPSSGTECCHLRRSPKGVQVSSTPEACVGLGRCPVRAQGSKVRFADKLEVTDNFLTIDRPRADASRMSSSVAWRSEEHTSELQSHLNLVCRLLLEKKKTS